MAGKFELVLTKSVPAMNGGRLEPGTVLGTLTTNDAGGLSIDPRYIADGLLGGQIKSSDTANPVRSPHVTQQTQQSVVKTAQSPSGGILDE